MFCSLLVAREWNGVEEELVQQQPSDSANSPPLGAQLPHTLEPGSGTNLLSLHSQAQPGLLLQHPLGFSLLHRPIIPVTTKLAAPVYA